MVSKTLRFYLIRLRRASMAEMVHRLKEALLVSRLSLFKGFSNTFNGRVDLVPRQMSINNES